MCLLLHTVAATVSHTSTSATVASGGSLPSTDPATDLQATSNVPICDTLYNQLFYHYISILLSIMTYQAHIEDMVDVIRTLLGVDWKILSMHQDKKAEWFLCHSVLRWNTGNIAYDLQCNFINTVTFP